MSSNSSFFFMDGSSSSESLVSSDDDDVINDGCDDADCGDSFPSTKGEGEDGNPNSTRASAAISFLKKLQV